MSRLNVVLAAILVALSAVVVLSTLSLRRALRAAQAETAQLLATDQDRQREIVDLKNLLARARAVLVTNGLVTPPGGLGPDKMPAKRSPEAEARAARDARREMMQMYGQGLAALHLPPEKLAALKRLLMDMNLSGSDLYEAAQAAGIALDSPDFRDFAAKSRHNIESEISTLIGAEDWSKLQESAGISLFQQSVHNSLAYDFSDAGLPLSSTQEEAVARALAESEKMSTVAPSHPPGYFMPDPATGLKPADQAILIQVAEILTPAQLQVLASDLAMENRSVADPAGESHGSSGTSTGISMETVKVPTEMPAKTADEAPH
jgi:hypothetical protein